MKQTSKQSKQKPYNSSNENEKEKKKKQKKQKLSLWDILCHRATANNSRLFKWPVTKGQLTI